MRDRSLISGGLFLGMLTLSFSLRGCGGEEPGPPTLQVTLPGAERVNLEVQIARPPQQSLELSADGVSGEASVALPEEWRGEIEMAAIARRADGCVVAYGYGGQYISRRRRSLLSEARADVLSCGPSPRPGNFLRMQPLAVPDCRRQRAQILKEEVLLRSRPVTLVGFGFRRGARVNLGTEAAPDVTYQTPGSLTFTVPASLAGPRVAVQVLNPDGSSDTREMAVQ